MGIEKFRGRRQPHVRDLEQQPPRDLQAGLYVLRTVEARVVDQPLPADGRARFLKIDAHDNFHAVGKFLAQRVQPGRVFERALFIMDRAGPDDDEQARVLLPQNADDPFAAAGDGGVRGFRRRCQGLQGLGRREPDDFIDV